MCVVMLHIGISATEISIEIIIIYNFLSILYCTHYSYQLHDLKIFIINSLKLM